jgi:hypothetical protein
MTGELHRLFHKLWTRDVGTSGYNKQDWLALEAKINDLEHRVTRPIPVPVNKPISNRPSLPYPKFDPKRYMT